MTAGADWVHRFHTGAASAAAAGIADIGRGQSRPARILGWLLRLPPAAGGQSARLRIVRQTRGPVTYERWIRAFGTVTLATRQVRCGQRVRERVGPVELRMRYRVTESGIWYIPDGAAVILGRFSFPLPGLLAPQARAHAWSSGESAFGAEVSVRVPLLGVLLSYRGHFTEVDE
jgi:hypothetical protein